MQELVQVHDSQSPNAQIISGRTQHAAVSKAGVATKYQHKYNTLPTGALDRGYQISEGQRSEWFKLLLDPDSSNIDIGQAKYYADPQAAPPGYNQEREDIVKDYLSALRRHIQAVLQGMLPQSVALSTPIKYVLTGIVSEPEAAAIWALQAVHPEAMEIRDTFVVCDTEGGKVDLISCKITGLKPILRVTMVAPGKLGGHPSWQDDILEEASNRSDEVTKRCYDGSKTSHYQVPVPTFPNSPAYNIRRARYTLKGADLFNIFEPVIQDSLIQTTKKTDLDVKAVLLVGGFGENGYLYKRLQQAMAPEGIEVLKSPYGWTAVVRGALIKGLADHDPKNTEVNISGRCTCFHYGTESAKGEAVSEKKPIRWTYNYYDMDETGPPFFVGDTITMLRNDCEHAPNHYSWKLEAYPLSINGKANFTNHAD
ncbi:MAG: hypothetical protein Q9205_003836 [Flavoplaca limonia]